MLFITRSGCKDEQEAHVEQAAFLVRMHVFSSECKTLGGLALACATRGRLGKGAEKAAAASYTVMNGKKTRVNSDDVVVVVVIIS
jgi:hypothetical protein